MNICLKLTHPQAFQNVDEFVSSSDLEKVALNYLLTY